MMKKILIILSGLVLLTGNLNAQTTFNYTGSTQTYTVPVGVTSITIDACGAQGGGSFGGAGGLGARMTGTYAVTPGQVLTVIVGQQGLLQVGGDAQNSSGGGGGTFVYDATGPTLLVAAGGGGGKCNWTSATPLHAEAAGQVTTNGGASSDGNPGGTGGNGGNAGLWSGIPCAGGGTGWLTVGGGPYGGFNAPTWAGGSGYCGGGGGGCGGVGGYGGGGGGGNHYGGGGGGGGYSGGGGGTDPTHGGGGGSYSIGTAQSNTAGYQTGDGIVIITPGVADPCAGDVTPPSFTLCPTGSTVSNTSGTCGAVVNYSSPTATDNCTGSTGTQTFDYTGSNQTFTVPAGVTSVTIDARGAQGGGSFGGAGGLGARMTGTYVVTPGQVLTVIVGEQGLLQVGGNAQNSSGGGGGTFVYDATGPTLLVAAGGGGGKCNWTSATPLHAEAAGQVTTNGGASSDGNAGGTGGNGGNAGLWSGVPCAGGGTGWLTVGGGPYGGFNAPTWAGGSGYCGGGGGGCGGVGGYGGGGGGGNHYGGGGGGGGYSGGGGGTDPTHGGGGGSYSIGTAQSNTAGYQTGNGQVIIDYSTPGVTVSQTAGLASGATFPVGTTINTFTATDGSGNSATCSFSITVNDTEAPVADISNIDVSAECSVTVTAPTATDTCAGTITGTTGDPLTYNTQGIHIVNWTYDDGNGNTSTQTQTITIDDVTSPVPDSSSLPGLSGCSVTVSTTPTATDNCDGNINATTGDPLTYSSVGSFNITWTYTDGNGNTASQTQSVTVIDCSGINELEAADVNIYPNPNNGIFNIQLNNASLGGIDFKLMDAVGKVIYNKQVNELNSYYDFSYLSSGTYFIQLTGKNGRLTKEIVINR